MAVVDADIVFHGSAAMPDSDTPTQIGGAIDATRKVVFTDISPDGPVEVVSDGADTRTMTLHYVKDDGTITSEAKTLNGTTAVIFTDTIKTILKVLITSDATRVATLRKSVAGATLVTIEVLIVEARRAFYNAIAEATGGSTRTYYEKVFIKNTNGTDALTVAQIVLQADPAGVITFALEVTLGGTTDNGASNNRQVAPAGFTFDATTKNVAASQVLGAGLAQGMWLKLTLTAGLAANETTYTIRTQGVAA